MNADDLIEQGHRHQQAGEHARAAESYLQAFELRPTEGRLPWEAARLYLYFVNDAAKAVRWFEASLPLLPDAIMARDTRYHIGLAHVFLEDDARAQARFEEVLAHTGTHVLACLELGKLFTRSGEHDRAKDLLMQAALHNNMRSTLPEMFPDGERGSSHAHALAWLNIGRLGLVAEDGRTLVTAAAGHLLDDVEDVQRVVTLAKEARAAGKPDHAMDALDELLARHPRDEAGTALWFAIALDDLDQHDQVLEMAESLREEDPEWADRMVAEVNARR